MSSQHFVPAIPPSSFLPRVRARFTLPAGDPKLNPAASLTPNAHPQPILNNDVPHAPPAVRQLSQLPTNPNPIQPGQYNVPPVPADGLNHPVTLQATPALPPPRPPMALPQVQYNAPSRLGLSPQTVVLLPNVFTVHTAH